MATVKSKIRLRNETVGLVFAVLFGGFAFAQEALPPRQIPDSPSAVRSKLLYAQNTQGTAVQESPAGGLGDHGGAAVPAGQTGTTEPASQVALPTVEASVPEMPAPDQVSLNPAAQPGVAPVGGEKQLFIVQQLVGTAAAEVLPVTGVAASRPAGAALAPARQRRVRSVLIRVGSLVGAGVAIGTTMALSQGSPSRPPGSH